MRVSIVSSSKLAPDRLLTFLFFSAQFKSFLFRSLVPSTLLSPCILIPSHPVQYSQQRRATHECSTIAIALLAVFTFNSRSSSLPRASLLLCYSISCSFVTIHAIDQSHFFADYFTTLIITPPLPLPPHFLPVSYPTSIMHLHHFSFFFCFVPYSIHYPPGYTRPQFLSCSSRNFRLQTRIETCIILHYLL